jgi:hypothetical protein
VIPKPTAEQIVRASTALECSRIKDTLRLSLSFRLANSLPRYGFGITASTYQTPKERVNGYQA